MMFLPGVRAKGTVYSRFILRNAQLVHFAAVPCTKPISFTAVQHFKNIVHIIIYRAQQAKRLTALPAAGKEKAKTEAVHNTFACKRVVQWYLTAFNCRSDAAPQPQLFHKTGT